MIIGISGRIGAGKETVTKFLREKGFVYFETSAIIKEELVKLGKKMEEITRTDMQNWGDEQRRKDGAGAIMKVMLSKTESGKDYLFDSLRNYGEVVFMKQTVKDFVLIGVDADQKIRFERVLKRNKESDLKTWEGFLKMDERDNFDKKNDMGQQTGLCIENADFVIVNNNDLESAMKQMQEVYKKIFEVRVGKYQHFKGNFYQVLGIANHSETKEEYVVYKALYNPEPGFNKIWVRPKRLFLEEVEVNGSKVPRFKFVES